MSCPNIELLRSYGVYPRKLDFKYQADKFFIYVYLDPFVELKKPLVVKVPNPTGPKEFCFAYEPIYIGKGTGAGYRHNQHLKAFQSKRETNPEKIKAFQSIQDQMADAAATQQHDKPWNWIEYQKKYVIVLETFQDPKELITFEMAMIKNIGTRWDKTGTLTNKIKRANKFNKLGTGQRDLF